MRVALTFDDGPSIWTAPLLDLLAKHNAKATFFVCGHAVEAYPHLLTRMLAEGHEIGNHSYDHPRFTDLSDEEIVHQLRRTQELIQEHTGYVPIVWRAPYFDMNDRVVEWGEREYLRHVGAMIDPADWRSDAETIERRVLSPAFKDGAIIDLHDGIPPDGGSGTNTRQPTVDAVARILERNPETEFVTASEINRAVDPEDVAVIVVTRGDVKLDAALRPFDDYPMNIGVWSNATGEDLAVYGRYAAIDSVDEPVILVVDDDVALSRGAIEALLAGYQPGTLVANEPVDGDYRDRYTDSCLVGFGAIFDRDLPMKAFQRADELGLNEQVFHRTCDVVFTSLTPYRLIDQPFEKLPWSYGKDRMYKQVGFAEERGRVLEACRELREPACA